LAITTALGYTPYNATNPSSYITSAQAPVQSVAGRTGIVTLVQADISGLTTSSSPSFSTITLALDPVTSSQAATKHYVDTQIGLIPAGGVTSIIAGAGIQISGSTGNVTISTTAANTEYNAGSIHYFARSTPPVGYLEANGAIVSRTTYAELFTAIGTTFGAGDGSTTFQLPDLRGEFIRGWDHSRGIDTGRTFGSLQLDAFQGHIHSYPYLANLAGTAGGWNLGSSGSGTGAVGNPTTDGTNGAPRTAAETRPRNVALLTCIKITNSVGSQGPQGIQGPAGTNATLELVQNSQPNDYTLVLTDSGKHVFHPSSDTSARTFTIPGNALVAFPVGTAVSFINQHNAGSITITSVDPLYLAGAGTTGNRTLAPSGVATAVKVATNEWIIYGAGLT
jgi:microcystin-dependent protein